MIRLNKDDPEVQAMIEVLIEQRNAALDQAAIATGGLKVSKEQVVLLQAVIARQEDEIRRIKETPRVTMPIVRDAPPGTDGPVLVRIGDHG